MHLQDNCTNQRLNYRAILGRFFVFYIQLTVKMFIADDWIRTQVLFCWKQPLCLLCHNHFPEQAKGYVPGLFFLYFRLFNTVDIKQINVRFKSLPITGFELRTSGVGSDCSTNWATRLLFFPHWSPLIRTMFQVPQKGLKNQVRRHFTLLVPFSVDSPLLTKQSCGKGALLSLQNPRPRIASISRQMG